MDLGLSTLNDDQLLDLLNQACEELRGRDPFVRGLAQAKITDAADNLRIFKENAKEAVQQARHDYERAIGKEIQTEVRRAVSAGELRLIAPADEAEIAVDAEIKARIALIDEAVAQLKAGTTERFAFEISGEYIAFHHDGKNFQMAHRLTPDAARSIGASIRKALEAA